jgi:motility quorum-sensing regulator/GCU-specific mRNA interferase toxin
MTAYTDHRLWQDVYHVPSEAGMLYVKFTADAVTEFLLLSFKEKDDDRKSCLPEDGRSHAP